MKVLILSCNTGQGHNAAGRAVLEELKKREIPCEMRDMLAMKKEKNSARASRIYVDVTTRAPKIFGGIYHAGALISSARFRSPVYWANALCARQVGEYVRKNGFDCVVASHLFPAEALTYLRKHEEIPARCYAVATDYASIPFWEETRMDAYFIPHEDLKQEFAGKGIPEGKLVASGIPVSSKFRGRRDTKRAREALGCLKADHVFTVMSGSMGFGNLGGTVKTLLEKGTEKTRIFVLAGRNRELARRLKEQFGEDRRVLVTEFTEHPEVYMDACDVLITKPGGLTSTEAAVREVPLVHSAPIPGCETANVRFFQARGMSVEAEDEREAAELAWMLAGSPEKQREMMAAQREEIPKDAAARICDWIQK